MHLNHLVRTQGVVVSTKSVFPQLNTIKYDCAKCNYVIGPLVQFNKEIKRSSCSKCKCTKPFKVSLPKFFLLIVFYVNIYFCIRLT